jgi:hypothetical protein
MCFVSSSGEVSVKLKMLVLGLALTLLVPLAAIAYESQPSNTVGFMRFTTTTAAKQKVQTEAKDTAETRATSQQKDKATPK